MPTEIWHIDNLVQECGYFTSLTSVNNGYGCRHPEQEDVEPEHEEWLRLERRDHPDLPAKCGRCFTFTCPIATELDPSEEEDRAEFIRHGENPDMLSEGSWMLVETNAGCPVGAKPEVPHAD